jgi:hypothetical protein
MAVDARRTRAMGVRRLMAVIVVGIEDVETVEDRPRPVVAVAHPRLAVAALMVVVAAALGQPRGLPTRMARRTSGGPPGTHAPMQRAPSRIPREVVTAVEPKPRPSKARRGLMNRARKGTVRTHQ